MCFAARQFSEAVDLTFPTVPNQRTLWFKRVTETAEGDTAPGLWHVLFAEYFINQHLIFHSLLGELTDLGRKVVDFFMLTYFTLTPINSKTSFNFGTALRKLYVDR